MIESKTKSATQHEHTCLHSAHLYADASALAREVASFSSDAIERGASVVWIASQSHAECFGESLRAQGHSPTELRRSGQLAILDADRCLVEVMRGRTPQRKKFDAIVRSLVEQGLRQFSGVAAYGELVDILAQQGNEEAAAKLEQWWSALIAEFDISLMCGYRLNLFDDRQQRLLDVICHSHTHVFPILDRARLEWAVDEALRVTFMDADVGALREVLLERFAHDSHVPSAQAVLMALNEILPNVAHNVRMLARDYYSGNTPLT